MTIGEKIKELRKKAGLTQEKLAQELSISRQTISSWESDLTSPDLNQAKKICEFFKIHIEDLVSLDINIHCKQTTPSILNQLIGKHCFIDTEEDSRMDERTPCLVLDVHDSFIKVEIQEKKETVIKLLDLNLVSSLYYFKED